MAVYLKLIACCSLFVGVCSRSCAALVLLEFSDIFHFPSARIVPLPSGRGSLTQPQQQLQQQHHKLAVEAPSQSRPASAASASVRTGTPSLPRPTPSATPTISSDRFPTPDLESSQQDGNVSLTSSFSTTHDCRGKTILLGWGRLIRNAP